MPSYRFKWTNLQPQLLTALCRELELYVGEDGPAAALRVVYGARPTEDFVPDAWPILREQWLRNSKDSRNWVVAALQAARRESGTLLRRNDQMEYLRNLKVAKNLRRIVWEEFVAAGEPKHDERSPDFVVHMTGRPGTRTYTVPEKIQQMSPEQRLQGILQEKTVRGWKPFGKCSLPTVSFTESHLADIAAKLIMARHYAAWGIVFRKQTIFDVGGGPAWYVRQPQWEALSPELRSWAVRTEPNAHVNWIYEREWRLPVEGEPPGFRFRQKDVHAIIVDSRFDWLSDSQDDGFVVPQWVAKVPCWHWDSQLHCFWKFSRGGKTKLS